MRECEERIIGILKQHEAGLAVAKVCRWHGIGDATLYTWRSKHGDLEVSEAERKALEGKLGSLNRAPAVFLGVAGW